MIEKFWAAHSRKKKPDYYSEEFKDLIINMLKFDPQMRPNADAIFEHPWFTQGNIATQEEVRLELEKRHKVNQECE